MASSSRRDTEMLELVTNDFKVEMINDSLHEFIVDFHGPKDSLYEGGLWKVRVELPESYPYKSPSVGFATKIYHPNVDEASGTICLNVLNEAWSAGTNLVNVFESFLPQLLLYPNELDPMNENAAALMMRDRAAYEQRVIEYRERYAKKPETPAEEEEEEEEPSDDDSA